MKKFAGSIALLLSVLLCHMARSQSVLDPNDPVVNYNPANPPAQPPAGQIGKWVRTPRNFWWNADVYKPYIYNGYGFRLRFPKTYNPAANDGKKYPLLVFFHGYGEIGPNTDNEFHLLHGAEMFSRAVDNGTFDGYVLFMQSDGFFHGGHYQAIIDIINYMIQHNKLDPFDIVANGLSSGGEATWQTTINFPTYYSACIPMSWCNINYSDANIINKLRSTPIWLFQGGVDWNPPPSTSRAVRDAFLAQGAQFRYTEYPEVDHSTWYRAWSEPDFWPFLNRAYSANPWPLYGRSEYFPNETVNTTLSLPPGFAAYQWRKDGAVISGATSHLLNVTQFGTYDARVQRNGIWSEWSRIPVQVKLKAVVNLPGRVEAENYAAMDGVGIDWTFDGGGGSVVGWIDQNDWMDYSVHSASASTYTVRFRVASPNTGGQLQLRRSDGTVLTTVNIPNTGGWQSYQNVEASVSLPAGYQTIRLISTAAPGWNINWFEFGSGGTANQPPTANAGPDKTVTLPTNSVTLNGSGTDPDGTVTAYSWTRVSGPAGSSFSNPSSATTTVNNLVQGSYVFRLTVTDNSGASASDEVTVTVVAATGNYVSLPAKIEAENWTAMSGVQTEGTWDAGGGQNVGWIDNGDWMDYNINVPSAGTWTMKLRIATPNNGAQLQVRRSDGSTITTINLPNTGSWQGWQTHTANISLAQGNQTIRLISTTTNGWNINWFELTQGGGNIAPTANAGPDQTITLPTNSVTLNGSGADADGTITAYSWSKVSGPAQGTFSSTTVPNPTVSNLAQGTYVFRLTVTDNSGATGSDDVNVTVNPTPGLTTRIEAENWTAMSGVQTEGTWDAGGGLNVGWIDNGDWMDYTLNVASAGSYTLRLRIATPNTGARLQVRRADGTVLSTVTLPNTGAWQSWQTVSTTIQLVQGVQVIRLISTTTNGWNINWLEIASGSGGEANLFTQAAVENTPSENVQVAVYPNPVQDQMVLKINNGLKGNLRLRIAGLNGALHRNLNFSKQQELIQLNINTANLPKGQYLLIIEMDGWRETRKLTRL